MKNTFTLYWNMIAEEFEMDSPTSEKWMNLIISKYTEPHRHYHTLEHIVNCLQMTEVFDYNFSKSSILALVFHDVVYDTKSKFNEEDSFIFCSNFLSEVNKKVNPITNNLYYIGLTKHDENSYIQASRNKDLAYFLDVDLSVLGFDQKDYMEYADNVKKEYLDSGIRELDYYLGRCKFLDSLLKKDKIFHTEEAQKLLEEQARKNIKKK